MSVGFKNNKTLFLDTEEIYWKNLKIIKLIFSISLGKKKSFSIQTFDFEKEWLRRVVILKDKFQKDRTNSIKGEAK